MDAQEYKKQTGFSFHDSENQAILRKFVELEVVQCVSMLISHFAQNPSALDGSDYDYEEVMDLCRSVDYEEAAWDKGWREFSDGFFKEDDNQYYLSVNLHERGLLNISVHKQDYPEQGTNGKTVWEFNGTEDEADEAFEFDLTDPEDVREYLVELEIIGEDATVETIEDCDFETSDAEDWQELCENESIEGYESDILEHWIVSDYLARKLEEKGETVSHDFFGLTIWGRGCSGQAILLDYVIADIASDMEILKGQKYEWRV
jgi:hypothetical protein